MKVGVAGASGYAGGELLRLLLAHPEVEVGALTGQSSAGTQVGQHHPHLAPLADRLIAAHDASAFDGHDAVFLALPHGHSAAFVDALPADINVFDCGADFRLRRADEWQWFYDTAHAGTWPYGLPELPGAREQLRGATRVAVPGCYPTATTLAIWPALAAGMVEPDVVVVAASGTSGAGRSLKSSLLGSEVMGSMSAYGVGGVHRHTPEIRQTLSDVAGTSVTVSFTPTLAPMSRGILATVVAPLSGDVADEAVRRVYEDAYGDEKFVHLLSVGQWPATSSTLASNAAYVQVTVDVVARRLIAVCAIDNLTKGTAGQAVQCMNIAMGWDEAAGLSSVGVAP